jgi:hypothetical protein
VDDDPKVTHLWGPITACSLCGRSAESDQLPLDWSLDFSARGPRPVCSDCTRTRLHDIEGKLNLGDPWES